MILLEGAVMCFALLMVCVCGIRNGAVGLVSLYESDVQERVVQLGLITKDQIRRQTVRVTLALFVPTLVLVPLMVYGLNGVTSFWDGFGQMTAVMLISGLFDRFFIDWYWVGKTKAWDIPGTEDLKPYIPLKVVIRKWAGTLIGFPLMALMLAGIMSLFV